LFLPCCQRHSRSLPAYIPGVYGSVQVGQIRQPEADNADYKVVTRHKTHCGRITSDQIIIFTGAVAGKKYCTAYEHARLPCFKNRIDLQETVAGRTFFQDDKTEPEDKAILQYVFTADIACMRFM
jgi:hypothetical protein